jgi:hypothetical protein
MVHSENQDERQNKATQKILRDLKELQDKYKSANEDGAAKRLEALATSGSTIDAGVLIETI